jgi:hypothetical protein
MMTPRELTKFLQVEMSRPFEWGQSDCCMSIANLWRHVHGNDPAAWLRGTYSTVTGKDATVAANRGLQRLVTRIAANAGAARTPQPNTGDFGLIVVGGKPFGAICTGRVGSKVCWAVRSETGFAFLTNPRILRAWSIHELGQDISTGPL